MSDEEPDDVLLNRFRAGDESAAEGLYHRYATRLRALAERRRAPDLAGRVDADDILQSVFRSFFRRAARGQYEVPAGEELWHLLVVITLNKVRSAGDRHRARKRDSRLTVGGDEGLERAAEAGDRDARSYLILQSLVSELIGELPVPSQQMVRMRLEGHEVSEIAEVTGRSKRTVERVLQAFRITLRGHLTEDD